MRVGKSELPSNPREDGADAPAALGINPEQADAEDRRGARLQAGIPGLIREVEEHPPRVAGAVSLATKVITRG